MNTGNIVMPPEEALDQCWAMLAEAIDAAGPAHEELFLRKLALLLSRELGDPARLESYIATALKDVS